MATSWGCSPRPCAPALPPLAGLRLAPVPDVVEFGQRVAQLGSAPRAQRRVLLQAGEDEPLEAGGHRALEPRRRRLGERMEVVAAHLHRGRPAEDVGPRQEVVAHGSQAVEIAAGIDGVGGPDRLRREVEGRALEHVGLGQPRARGRLEVPDQAEVDHLGDVGDPAALAENDVLRLDVPVDEADAVGLHQGRGDLPQHVGHARRGLGPVPPHECVEVGSLEILHRVVEDAVGRVAVVEDGHGVGVREAGRELHLSLEAREGGRARLLGRDELDRGGPPQHRVASAVDRAHASLAELLLERVLAEVAGLLDLLAQAVDHVRDERGHDDSARRPQPRPEALVPGDDRVGARWRGQPREGRQDRQGREQAHARAVGGGARHHHRPDDDHVGEDQDQRVRHLPGEGGRHEERLRGEADEDDRHRGGVDRPQEAGRQRRPARADLPRGQADHERRRVEQRRARVAVVRPGEGGHDEERSPRCRRRSC